MVEVTLQLDEELADRVKRIAERRHTTVDEMVGQYIAQLPDDDGVATAAATDQLLQKLRQLSRPIGGKPWKSRDELY